MSISDAKHLSTGNNAIVRHVKFSPDGSVLVACCDDGTLCKWNIADTVE